MICYKDRTYCPFHILCSVTTDECDMLTDEIIEEAQKVNLPIAQYSGFPPCFVPFFMGKK